MRSVLVTGASTGIGGATAPRLDGRRRLDAKVQVRIKPFVPTPVFDAIIARMMDLGPAPEVGD